MGRVYSQLKLVHQRCKERQLATLRRPVPLSSQRHYFQPNIRVSFTIPLPGWMLL